MKIGGYQIIDLKGKNLTVDVGMVYEGIYNLIEGTNKAILISGLVVGGVEYDDTIVECNVVGSNFECVLHGYKLSIQDNDVITVSTVNQSSVAATYEAVMSENPTVIDVKNGSYYIAFSNIGGVEVFTQGITGYKKSNSYFDLDIKAVTSDKKGMTIELTRINSAVKGVTILAIK